MAKKSSKPKKPPSKSARTVSIAIPVLRDFLERMFVAAGCDLENARITADDVIEADLRGHRIQGTDHLGPIITGLKNGTIRGKARPRILRETPATAQVDGDGATGHVAGRFAVDVVVRKAKAVGVAVVGLVRAGDLGMLGAYVERIARAGLAGMTFTNGNPRVHVPGGIDPILGTNPVAFGFPVQGGDPVVIDFATSAAAMGHVRIASYTDKPIAKGLAIDKNGKATTNAKAAIDGAFTAIGGHKGFGLSLAGTLLSGPIIGALIGRERIESSKAGGPPERGHTIIAIDPSAFGDTATNLKKTRRYLDEIKASRKAKGVDEILIPGERSFRTRRKSMQRGIEILEASWRNTLQLASELGVKAPDVKPVS